MPRFQSAFLDNSAIIWSVLKGLRLFPSLRVPRDCPVALCVQDEIFDMAHPKDPTRITIEDFLECGTGSIIVR